MADGCASLCLKVKLIKGLGHFATAAGTGDNRHISTPKSVGHGPGLLDAIAGFTTLQLSHTMPAD
jgi:hypothetical protein